MPITINGAGTITGVSIGGLPDGIVDTDMLANNAVTAAKRGAGGILQVVQNHVISSHSQSFNANTTTDITNLSASITPLSATSDMLVFVMLHGEMNTNPHNTTFGLKRGTTQVGMPAAAGFRTINIAGHGSGYGGTDNASTIDNSSFQYFDTGRSSGTSQITYQVTMRNTTNSTFVLNRTINNTDNPGYERLTSNVTILEVAA